MKSTWQKSPLIWREGKTEYISVVFTWDLPKVRARIRQGAFGIDRYIVGGPAVKMLPDYFSGDPVEIRDDYPGVLQKYNPLATRTSRGCHNWCGFCAVEKIHPIFKEINDYQISPVICDDNLLQCTLSHFDQVIDRLKALDWCDFNQGLDASMLTEHHAERLGELKNPIIRLAWNYVNDKPQIEKAILFLRRAGLIRGNIRCYVLIGYDDTPRDALYRLETLYHEFKIKPNPMRYQPPGCLEKNSYVAPNWSHQELDRFMSYWANLRFTAGVPFSEYVHHKKRTNPKQLTLI